jgi:hypothetical protein
MRFIKTESNTHITFNTIPQRFNKQFNLLIENLNTNTADGYKSIFAVAHSKLNVSIF